MSSFILNHTSGATPKTIMSYAVATLRPEDCFYWSEDQDSIFRKFVFSTGLKSVYTKSLDLNPLYRSLKFDVFHGVTNDENTQVLKIVAPKVLGKLQRIISSLNTDASNRATSSSPSSSLPSSSHDYNLRSRNRHNVQMQSARVASSKQQSQESENRARQVISHHTFSESDEGSVTSATSAWDDLNYQSEMNKEEEYLKTWEKQLQDVDLGSRFESAASRLSQSSTTEQTNTSITQHRGSSSYSSMTESRRRLETVKTPRIAFAAEPQRIPYVYPRQYGRQAKAHDDSTSKSTTPSEHVTHSQGDVTEYLHRPENADPSQSSIISSQQRFATVGLSQTEPFKLEPRNALNINRSSNEDLYPRLSQSKTEVSTSASTSDSVSISKKPNSNYHIHECFRLIESISKQHAEIENLLRLVRIDQWTLLQEQRFIMKACDLSDDDD